MLREVARELVRKQHHLVSLSQTFNSRKSFTNAAPGLANCYLLIALLHRHVLIRIRGPDVLGARADQPVVVELFDHMRGPAADAGDGEDRREQINVYPPSGVGGSGVEANLALHMFFVLAVLLDLRGHTVPLGIRRAP